jgi:hypothetical protein
MEVRFTIHARRRMHQYDISEDEVIETLREPDDCEDGHSGRSIAQRRQNEKVLRVIYSEQDDIKTVVTTYRAEADRYGV